MTKAQKQIAQERIRKLNGYLSWIMNNPGRVDPKIAPVAKDFLQMEIAQTEREMKNTRRGGRVLGLRIRLGNLLVAILPQKSAIGKDGTQDGA